MRVVVAHSKYLSAASGENQVVDDEARLLTQAGHEVTRFEPQPDAHGFGVVRTAAEAVWSVHALRHLRNLIRETRADVLHCHNLFPELSPAVLRMARDTGVAVVVTLHNYRMLCVTADLLRDGRVCEDCVGRGPWRGVRHACYRNSRLGSATIATSLSLHRRMHTFDLPQQYLAVSEFVRQKHIQAGWPAERIRVKPNFAWPCQPRSGSGSYFLYVGRLSPEKGLENLMETWRKVDAQLVVVGDGPLRDRLHGLAPANVSFTGSLPRDSVDARLRDARALVLPSICYEGQPRTILEAFAAGIPVIASSMGGLPELVGDNLAGRVVQPGAHDEWRAAVDQLMDDAEAERMGTAALERWRTWYSPSVALALLESAYEEALAGLLT